jgi:ferredoxin/flavodoxin---NADP+ reductase
MMERAPRAAHVALPPLPVRSPAIVPRATAEANATLAHREDVSDTIARFIVRPDGGPIDFRPGQYVSLGMSVDGRSVERPYSIASWEPAAPELELLVRLVHGGALTPALWRASPGTRVRLGRAKGHLELDDDAGTHLFVATGTGVAPFVGMLRWLAESGSSSRAVLIHGVARREDLAFRPELEGWQDEGLVRAYVPTVSRPADPANAGWSGRAGRAETIVGDVCQELDLDPAATAAYLCGNPAMVGAAEAALRSLGLAAARVRSERYWTPAVAVVTDRDPHHAGTSTAPTRAYR